MPVTRASNECKALHCFLSHHIQTWSSKSLCSDSALLLVLISNDLFSLCSGLCSCGLRSVRRMRRNGRKRLRQLQIAIEQAPPQIKWSVASPLRCTMLTLKARKRRKRAAPRGKAGARTVTDVFFLWRSLDPKNRRIWYFHLYFSVCSTVATASTWRKLHVCLLLPNALLYN